MADTKTTCPLLPLPFSVSKDIHQEWTPVEDVGRFLLTVRAEYLFLIILHHSYMDDHSRVQMEYEDFCRYGYRDIFCRNSFNSSLCFFA
jgi:hypothetical protein